MQCSIFFGKLSSQYLESQDALEVMGVSHLLSVSTDLTDVALVSEDTYWRLYWCEEDENIVDDIHDILKEVFDDDKDIFENRFW